MIQTPMAPAPRIRTTSYVFSHGHAPRGRGRWAFQVGDTITFLHGTYTEVKRQILVLARAQHIHTIDVLP